MRVYNKKRTDPTTKIEGTKSFSLGLSQLGHPSVIKPNELAESLNVLCTLNGVLEKRPGSKIIGNIRGTSTHLNSLAMVNDIGGSDYFLRISNDGILQRYIWASDIWVDIAGSPTFTDTKTKILQSWNKVYILNDTDAFTTWDGTSFEVRDTLSNPTVSPTVELIGNGRVSAVLISAGGSGYAVGNVLSLTGGNSDCTLTVSTVASGVVTAVSITNAGSGYATGTGQATTVAPAGGTGCTINVTKVLGSGVSTAYYRYAWQSNGGQTLASDTVSVTGLPNFLDAEAYVKVTLPSAPANATKTIIFKGNTAGDETYLTSLPVAQTVYEDKGFDDSEGGTSDYSIGIPASNTTAGMHFKDGLVTVYHNSLCGITTEMGDDCIVSSGVAENFGQFGAAEGGEFFYWRKDDGSKIMAMHEFQEALYVFKTDKIGALTFDVTVGMRMSTVSLASGAVSMDSVHAAGNDLRYWSVQGAMSLGNEPNFVAVVRTKVLSARADRVVEAINQAELSNICGVFYKSHSLWGLPQGITGSGNTTVIAYNERFAAWSEWFGLKPKEFVKVVDPDNKERLFCSAADSANVKELWTGRDDCGDSIYWRVATKQFDANVSYKYKTYSKVFFIFGNVIGGNTRVQLTENGYTKGQLMAMYASSTGLQGFGVDEWGTMEFGDSSGDVSADASGLNIRFCEVGYKDLFSLQATFTNDGLSDTIQLMGMFIEYSDSSLPLPSSLELTPVYE